MEAFDTGTGGTLLGNSAYTNGSDGIQTGTGSTVQSNSLRANGGRA